MNLTRDEMLTIKKYFFREGVCLVEEKSNQPHPELEINDKQVMKFMTSLVSKGLARKQFNWRHAYFFITDEGIDALKKDLSLEDNEMPLTHLETNLNVGYAVENEEKLI
ncbi:40s ribosomal protein s10 [Trachipleistophora hominis]|uniref:40s ribosomal protein s10 n=1 Tax=Trachipleistophora hominis TaxID=72359 RepID=L7JZF2_TRAHO|nr:40s ribosomal protein s10 [Trachipleistophora hominis]